MIPLTSRRTSRVAAAHLEIRSRGAGGCPRGSHDLSGPSPVREAVVGYADSEDHAGHRTGAPLGPHVGHRHCCGRQGTPTAPPRAFAARPRKQATAGAGREALPFRALSEGLPYSLSYFLSYSVDDRDRGGER